MKKILSLVITIALISLAFSFAAMIKGNSDKRKLEAVKADFSERVFDDKYIVSFTKCNDFRSDMLDEAYYALMADEDGHFSLYICGYKDGKFVCGNILYETKKFTIS